MEAQFASLSISVPKMFYLAEQQVIAVSSTPEAFWDWWKTVENQPPFSM